MKCPFCNSEDTQVKDSRPSDDGAAIRRRRECTACDARFTTFERIQLRDMMVMKNDGRREPFDRAKLMRSLKLPLQKRPVEEDAVERAVSNIVRELERSGEADIPTKEIGDRALAALSALDHVAYVRYASIYKDFREVGDFNSFLVDLKKKKKVENG